MLAYSGLLDMCISRAIAHDFRVLYRMFRHRCWSRSSHQRMAALGRLRLSPFDPELSVRQDPQSRHLMMYEAHRAWHQLSARATVFVTNSPTEIVQQPRGAQYRRGGGFHGQLFTVFSYSMRAVKLSHKPLFAFFSCQFRPQAPDMACGLVRSTLR